ncbi:hypothetical protein CTI12_AA338520 [Artemisia annua]|uniref:Uncharacterized protein n=1 Tax=Artemisia annua TaxID=35608 RepID=A0A2U1MV66_ARTAN|nr:hypothetical protein CTI12_AA338520 [Artemisia annua]
MPKRKARKVAKKPEASNVNENDIQCDADTNGRLDEDAFVEQEVGRQSTAIRTIRDMEIERLLTAMRLLKSNISNEQLQTPLLPFFEENLPNLTVSKTDMDGPIEVKWKVSDDDMNTANGGNMMSLFLQRMSMAYPDHSNAMQSLGGFEFSNKAGTTSIIGADNLQMKDFVLEEPSDTHILGIDDNLQTPGVCCSRSFLCVCMLTSKLRN